MRLRARLGRPPKYGRPAKAITVTLPDDVLARLRRLHPDPGLAIVHLVERRMPTRVAAMQPAEVARYGNHAVIIVTPTRALRKLKGVQLVPIGDGRALISLDASMSIPALELQLREALDAADLPDTERSALQSIADILRKARGTRRLTLEGRTIIVMVLRASAQ